MSPVQDSLGGNTKTYIVANVSPEAAHYGETLSTLNYVNRAKQIRNKVRACILGTGRDFSLVKGYGHVLRRRLAGPHFALGFSP